MPTKKIESTQQPELDREKCSADVRLDSEGCESSRYSRRCYLTSIPGSIASISRLREAVRQLVGDFRDRNWRCGKRIRPMVTSDARGFTLIELVAALSIVAILIALSLPAIGRVRETSRRTTCDDHLRQLALAMHLHAGVFGFMPSNGGYIAGRANPLPAGLSVQPETLELSTGDIHLWGVGNPQLAGREQAGSWLYAILPFIEQQNAWQQVATQTRPSQVACPSRSGREPSRAFNDASGRYRGGDLVWAKTDYAANGYLIQKRPEICRFNKIADGLSSTVLLGEKSHDPMIQTPPSWIYDEPFWLGGSRGTTRKGAEISIDGQSENFRIGWGSAHGESLSMAGADGSVHHVAYETDVRVIEQLLDPNDSSQESTATIRWP